MMDEETKQGLLRLCSIKSDAPLFDFGMNKGSVASCRTYANEDAGKAADEIQDILKSVIENEYK